MDHRGPDDEQLMRAYQRGDQSAFEVLYFRYVEPLRAFLARGLWTQEDSRDLVQETFVRIHRARHDYDSERPFQNWLFGIGLNVKRDYLKRNRPVTGTSNLIELLDVAAPYGRVEDREYICSLIRRLPLELRDLIRKHWLCGLSYAAIAERLGSTEGAVKVRAHRAIQTLRSLARPAP